MRAVAYKNAGKIDRDDAFENVDLPTPVAAGRDLLVEVKAVSVNPSCRTRGPTSRRWR